MKTKVHPVVRLLPSLTDLAFVMPIVFLFSRLSGARTMLFDCDTGWHIRAGEWILAHGRVPTADMFSFTKPGAPWYAWEWLWEAIFALIHRHAGMAAVVLVNIGLIALTSALLFRLARRKCGNAPIAFGVTLLAMAGSSLHWLARPHLVTLLFLVIFYWLLERARDAEAALPGSGVRLLCVLPALMVLWTNLHGGFFTGIILTGAYAAGEFALWLISPDAACRRAALARGGRYLAAAFACVAATFVNPYFYELHLHLARFLTDSYHYKHIGEFLAFSFRHPLAPVIELMIVLGVAAACWSVYRRRFVYAFLIAGWLHLALISRRNMAIFVIVAAPPVAALLHDLLLALRRAPLAPWIERAASAFGRLAADLDGTDRIARLHLVSAAALVLVGAVLYAPAPPERFRADFDPKRYPAAALDFLGDSSGARIFTKDEWGDYLIYSHYPKTKVFVDGRSDFYGDEFEEKYSSVMSVKHDWERTLAGFGIDTILLPPDAPLASTLKQARRWQLVYDDGVAIVFRAREAAGGPQQFSTASVDSGKGHDRALSRAQRRESAAAKSKTT